MFKASSFVEWLESNLVSLILAVLLALVVWVVATQEANPSEEFTFDQPIPIEFVGPDETLTITNSPTRFVTVRVRAPRSTISSLSLDNFSARVNLTDLEAGQHTVPVKVSIVDAQAVAEDYAPTDIEVELEALAERRLPIQLVINGELPTGYQTGTTSVVPSEVTIRGPQTAVQLVSEVRATISVDNQRDAVEETVDLAALDSDGNTLDNVQIEPATALVEIPITQEADFREVAVRVNANVQPAEGYYVSSITVTPPLIPVRGDPEILRELTSIETEPINLGSVQSDETYVARLNPPDGVTLEDVRTVTVYIAVEAQLDFRVLEVPVQAIGLEDNGLTVTIAPSNAVVSLSGPLPVLQRLNFDQDILVTIDVSGLEPGTYRLEPQAEIVSGAIPQEEVQQVTIDSVLPTVVEVEITEEDGN